ncbi:hypothetical protein HPB52_007730 [Rhipicephalus sanguineus]|uniref:Uncharacterized protein n=1 Tax=Rhipicephalus sanguineus TaxID=34632 RepID=A0A9D4PS29_RHISA|nr:hypothetical protein HPB52_007730 [Rhipicephalus sanguineus]
MVVARSDGAAAAGMDTPDDPVLLAKQSDWNKASQLFHLDSIRVKHGVGRGDAPICASRRRRTALVQRAGSQIRGAAGTRNNVAGVEGAAAATGRRRLAPSPRLFYERADLGASAAAPPGLIGAETALANGEPKTRLCKGRPPRGSAPGPTPLSCSLSGSRVHPENTPWIRPVQPGGSPNPGLHLGLKDTFWAPTVYNIRDRVVHR